MSFAENDMPASTAKWNRTSRYTEDFVAQVDAIRDDMQKPTSMDFLFGIFMRR
jgi:hypothetical protein